MDVARQIQYWTSGAEEDFAAARSLLEKGHLRHGLFFAHLALEKMLKALVTQHTREIPPRIHTLPRLAALAALTLDSERADFLREFGIYQIEGRCPDSENVTIGEQAAKLEFQAARRDASMVESAIVSAIRRYLAALPEVGIHASRAVLFGSFATGQAHEWSDIDLVVVAPEFDGPRSLSLVKALWRATRVDDRIEPIPCGELEWEGDDSRPILTIARREGVVIEADGPSGG